MGANQPPPPTSAHGTLARRSGLRSWRLRDVCKAVASRETDQRSLDRAAPGEFTRSVWRDQATCRIEPRFNEPDHDCRVVLHPNHQQVVVANQSRPGGSCRIVSLQDSLLHDVNEHVGIRKLPALTIDCDSGRSEKSACHRSPRHWCYARGLRKFPKGNTVRMHGLAIVTMLPK